MLFAVLVACVKCGRLVVLMRFLGVGIREIAVYLINPIFPKEANLYMSPIYSHLSLRLLTT